MTQYQSGGHEIKGFMLSFSVGQIRRSVVLRKPCNVLYVTVTYVNRHLQWRNNIENNKSWCLLCSKRRTQGKGKLEIEPGNSFKPIRCTRTYVYDFSFTNTIQLCSVNQQNAIFLKRCFRSIIALYMSRTFYVHHQKEFIVHAFLLVCFSCIYVSSLTGWMIFKAACKI
jgi:hypothetical protein